MSKKTISIAGAQQETLTKNKENIEDFGIEHFASVSINSSRSDGEEVKIENVLDDDVLEVELEDGIALFVRRDDYEKDYLSSSRSSDQNELVINQIKAGRASRGFTDWIVKAVDFFRVPVADKTGLELCKKFEAKTVKNPGLNVLKKNANRSEIDVVLEPTLLSKSTDKPILIFLHGTASNTLGSFGELFKNGTIKNQLFQFYNSKVYGFQHHTLTKSPIQNAIELAQSLPENSILHLVSHSRGGIVGELLCRATKISGNPISVAEVSIYKLQMESVLDDLDEDIQAQVKGAYDEQIADLKRLSEILKQKKLKIERFVRVACPARGTTLASGRLDTWLSVMFNLIGLIPVLKATPYYSILKNFIIALVKTRTKPHVLPGLEAQMPGSPLISLLNNNRVEIAADLTVISGDIEKQGILGKIALFFADKFYEDDHDLVVNTSSMYGGGERSHVSRFYFDKNDNVSHFNYFRNPTTATRVVDGLIGNESVLLEKFVNDLPELLHPIARSAAVHSGPRPIMYVLPGILGSELAANDEKIWADKWELITGGMGKLSIDKEHISPCGVIDSAYEKLIDYLSKDFEVVPFHFDWRLPLADEATRLSKSLSQSIEKNKPHNLPVHIIAHSMGGLVVRMMIATHRPVWEAMLAHDQSRFIMLGTPSRGSYAIPRVIVGQEKLIKLLALIDVKNSKREILKIISQYPGVLNMLPGTDSGLDPYAEQTWQSIAQIGKGKYPSLSKKLLKVARNHRALLDTVVFKDEPQGRIFYIAGTSDETPVNMTIENEKLKFQATSQGDGRVPWNTGIPIGIPTWYVDVVHGDLANYPASFPAIKEIIETGDTVLLSRSRPSLSRGVSEIFEMEEDEVNYLPDSSDLMRAAIGSSQQQSAPKDLTTKIDVTITHGDCVFAKYPISAGHYFNHGIYSAEAALDERLGNKLSQRNKLGLYPGRLNSCEVIFDPQSKPEGVIIVGLGDLGDLTVTKLTNTFNKAIKEYILNRVEFNQLNNVATEYSNKIGLSTVIIGSGSGGLAIIDCVQAILEGVVSANSAIEEQLQENAVTISQLQIIELWEDVAIYAVKQTKKLLELNTMLNERILCRPLIGTGVGGRYRSQYSEDESWWQRLQIRETEDNNLTFKTISDRARNEYRIVPNDRAKVDAFIEKATASTSTNNNLPKTLFEILIPSELKKAASSTGDTILLLNEGAARYPWELLEDRWSNTVEPPSVNFKIIRQLESEFFTLDPVVSTQNNALVVGAPILGSGWAKLPGAVNEAKLVTNLLTMGQLNTTSVIETKGFEVLDSIYSGSYKVLHLAGHGVYQYRVENVDQDCDQCGNPVEAHNIQSGMVISDNMILTPGDVEKIRFVPELIFINCCYLGEIEKRVDNVQFPRIAANLATQFIRKGARAVIAAGWEVDDQAALVFADTFYRSMLEGDNFAAAVQHARKETWQQHSEVNTWGAYQCYGDSNYKLVLKHSAKSQKDDWPYVAANELVLTLNSIANEADTKHKQSEYENLLLKLEHIETAIGSKAPGWLKLGKVNSAFADAFKNLGEFDKAISWYTNAHQSENADVTIHSTEQLANLLARQSVLNVTNARASLKDLRAAQAQINLSIEQLAQLIRLFSVAKTQLPTATIERLNLIGSAYKRKALIAKWLLAYKSSGSSIKDVIEALMESENYYLTAAWLSGDSNVKFVKGAIEIDNLWLSKTLPKSYSFVNYLTAKVLIHQLMPGNSKSKISYISEQDKHYLHEIEKVAVLKDKNEPGFWNLVSVADIQLIQSLIRDDFDKTHEQIAKSYKKAISRGASKVQIGSVFENILLIAQLYDPYALKVAGCYKQRKQIFNHLNELKASLE